LVERGAKIIVPPTSLIPSSFGSSWKAGKMRRRGQRFESFIGRLIYLFWNSFSEFLFRVDRRGYLILLLSIQWEFFRYIFGAGGVVDLGKLGGKERPYVRNRSGNA
jgi:hypothetical protein